MCLRFLKVLNDNANFINSIDLGEARHLFKSLDDSEIEEVRYILIGQEFSSIFMQHSVKKFG